MGKPRLTETTQGPLRRTVTVVGLAAAVLALVMTVAMVVVALGGFSAEALRICFLVWVLSLFTVFGVTRYLKATEQTDGHAPTQSR